MKKIIYLIFIILLGLAIYHNIKINKPKSFRPFEKWDEEKINFIKIKNKTDEFVFKKSKNKWEWNKKYRLDQQKVKNLIPKIKNLVVEEIISYSTSSWKNYKVQKENGIYIEVKNSKNKKRNFIIGRSAPGGNYYIRWQNEKYTRLSSGCPGWAFNKNENFFRARDVTNIDEEKVESIIFKHKNKEMRVYKKEVEKEGKKKTVFFKAYNNKEEELKIDEKNILVKNILKLNAFDFKQEKFDKSILEVLINLTTGEKINIEFFEKKGENDYMAIRGDYNEKYMIRKNTIDNIIKEF